MLAPEHRLRPLFHEKKPRRSADEAAGISAAAQRRTRIRGPSTPQTPLRMTQKRTYTEKSASTFFPHQF
jgi:hypothetical protein